MLSWLFARWKKSTRTRASVPAAPIGSGANTGRGDDIGPAAPAIVAHQSSNDRSELVEAARKSNVAAVQQLCAEGANPNIVVRDWTPLCAVAEIQSRSSYDVEGEIELTHRVEAIVRCLIKANADPNLPDGTPPLWWAIRYPRAAVVRALIEGGADVRCRFKDANSPLSYATEQLEYWRTKSTDAGVVHTTTQLEEIVELLKTDGSPTKRFANLAEHVAYALAYTDKDEDSRKEHSERIYVSKSCETCFHFSYPTQEHIQHKIRSTRDVWCASHDLKERRESRRRAVLIPTNLAADMVCDAWKEAELAWLLLDGFEPYRISYYRRHPILSGDSQARRKQFVRHISTKSEHGGKRLT